MSSGFRKVKLFVRRIVPAGMLSFLRVLPYYIIEIFEPSIKTPAGIAVPPLWSMFDGPRDKQMFLRNSEEVLSLYRQLGNLGRNSRVLDIGSGLGRKTLSLPEFLGKNAQYVGVDITRQGIDWCNKNIAAGHPNFQFLQLNVFNARYNKRGTVRAGDYRFPFSENSFDLIAGWSVFTHMFPADIRNYLKETSRMLNSEGRCIFSFYVMTEKSFAAVRDKIASERIEFEFAESCFTDNLNVPEDLTAFSEEWIRAAYESCGLEIETILFGSWSGDGEPRGFPMTNYQDIVVAKKSA
jgi:SAM-dependent methyltransferase